MVRDMDLIRRIVLTLQGKGDEHDTIPLETMWKVNQFDYKFNAELLLKSGLVEGEGSTLYGLTWAGHDFADSIQNEVLWDKVKAVVIDSGNGWTFSLLQEFISAEIKKKVSEST
ncbi:DUF2513 domain-containing protein [Salmonella enterica]|nr:DUF2513 domain-containing protein [Salmonella enterica]EHK5236366.1 DUF2513 domain-containing protein [Salmonella enterica]